MAENALGPLRQIEERRSEIQTAPAVTIEHAGGHCEHFTPDRQLGAQVQGALQGLRVLLERLEDDYAHYLAYKESHG